MSQLIRKNYHIAFLFLMFFSSCNKESGTELEIDYPTIIKNVSISDGASSINHDSPFIVNIVWATDSVGVLSGNQFRNVIDNAVVIKDGKVQGSQITWITTDKFSVEPDNGFFMANAEYSIEINAHYEILKSGKWQMPENSPYYEYKKVTFKTYSISTTQIDLENIKYSYPIINQYHYLQQESNKGFIQLKKPQGELFENKDFNVIVSNKSGYLFKTSSVYSKNTYRVNFDLPQDLKNETIYNLSLVEKLESDTVFNYYFRTSKFDDFLSKVEQLKDDSTFVYWTIAPYIPLLYNWYDFEPVEYLDDAESDPIIGLIQIELDKSSTIFDETGIDYMYSNYNKLTYDKDRNNISDERFARFFSDNINFSKSYYISKGVDFNDIYSFPPTRSVYIHALNDRVKLTNENITSNSAPAITVTMEGIGIYFYLFDLFEYDNKLIANAATNTYWGDPNMPIWADYLISTPFDARFAEYYNQTWNLHVNYTLPDGTITSVKTITLKNPK